MRRHEILTTTSWSRILFYAINYKQEFILNPCTYYHNHPDNSKKITEKKCLTDGTTVDATALATSTLLPHGTAGTGGMSGTHTGARNRLKKNLFCTTELGSCALCMFKSTYTHRQTDRWTERLWVNEDGLSCGRKSIKGHNVKVNVNVIENERKLHIQFENNWKKWKRWK